MTASPWLVPVTALKRAPGSARQEERSGPIGELRVADSTVPPGAEVHAVAQLSSVDGGIEVAAVVEAPWVGECRRCLQPLGGDLRCEVRELYRPHVVTHGVDEDEETYPLGGEHLDLRPLVRDALLLELPLAPLCRPDCRGLCPTCGADLNVDDCGCPPAAGDPRWGILDALREPEGTDGEGDRDDAAENGTA